MLSMLLRTQIQTATGEVVITNDGATILKHMAVMHPAARMVSSMHDTEALQCIRTHLNPARSSSNCRRHKT